MPRQARNQNHQRQDPDRLTIMRQYGPEVPSERPKSKEKSDEEKDGYFEAKEMETIEPVLDADVNFA